jgi:hypothetical protein
MKKILFVIGVILCFTVFSCSKKTKVKIDTSYHAGSPNIYIENVILSKDGKEIEEIAVLLDGETKQTDSLSLSTGEYTITWNYFTKNGYGAKLSKSEETEKITIDDNNNMFGVIGNKLYQKTDYLAYLDAVRIVDSLINKMQTDSIYVSESKDEMTGKISYSLSRKLILEDGKDNVEISLFVEKANNKFYQDGLGAIIDIGSQCVDDNEIIVLFDDESKMTINSWNDFNCDGYGFFRLTTNQCELLSTKKIKKIRVENGQNSETMTVELEKNKDYFVQSFYAINNMKTK